jgi:hypothetical protein
MTEKRTDLHPLKIRYHGTVDMAYDERYTEFIQPTGLLPFISLVSRGGPNMNAAALTALVDRWRPETHTFHLRAGEMTPTLQDVSMILGLPIQGEPLCMNTASDGWRRQMEDLIGMAPPAPENPKERAPAGAPFAWIRTNFGQPPPEDANEDTIRTYTRVNLWYMISRTLFPDSGGKLAHWCWLKALTVLEHRWSWGTTTLAYLYRQVMICCMYCSSIVLCLPLPLTIHRVSTHTCKISFNTSRVPTYLGFLHIHIQHIHRHFNTYIAISNLVSMSRVHVQI